jgi:hypothetical protein
VRLSLGVKTASSDTQGTVRETTSHAGEVIATRRSRGTADCSVRQPHSQIPSARCLPGEIAGQGWSGEKVGWSAECTYKVIETAPSHGLHPAGC